MKKLVISALSILILAALLISCGPKDGSTTPGNLTPSAQHTPHVSKGEVDVSSDYSNRLCTDIWLDTNSLHCCIMSDDGTYIWTQSKTDTEQIASGTWHLTKDDKKFLTLYLKDDASGTEQVLHELEFFETSFYAYDSEGNSVVWLTYTRDEIGDS